MTNQEKLLSAFKERRDMDFERLLKCGDIDVDYFYGEPDNGTLLDLACRSEENYEYVSQLIENGAKVWCKDEGTGKFKLHEIFKYYYFWESFWHPVCAYEFLSETGNEHASLNIMNIAVEENDIEAIELLAHSYSVVVHKAHLEDPRWFFKFCGLHPVDKHFILLQGSVDAVRVFIKYFDVDMEFQKDSRERVCSCREIILRKYPQLEAELPIRPPSDFPKILYSSLKNGAHELFLKQIAEVDSEILNEKPFAKAEYTYLHLACERNYIDVVDALLKKNVHLNEMVSLHSKVYAQNVTPIMLAAFNENYEIFEKLLIIPEVELQNEGGSGSVLHAVLHGMHHALRIKQYGNLSTDSRSKILELILKVHDVRGRRDELIIDRYRLDIEHTDANNKTALHYALTFNNEFAIRLLLRAGAKLYLEDHSILTSSSAAIMERYFDDCISYGEASTCHWTNQSNALMFIYRIFSQLDLYSIATKSKGNFFARFESVTEMRKLYKHPLTKSLLYVKWCLVKKYYYINLAFYVSFCLTLSTYIFLIQHCLPSLGNFNGSGSFDTIKSQDISPILCDVSLWMWLITLPFYMILILRELCQFSVSIRRYIGIPENWLEMMTIVVVGFLFTNETNAHLAASAILTSWIGLILLLGKQPSLSIYIEMFKTVALNFAKFLLLYSILIASFAYSFFILFKNKTSGHASSQNQTNVNTTDVTNENSIDPWQNLQMSFFKSIIMMTGEFEASTLPLNSSFSWSHVFFILFIFLVTMVLYSLLNGLAVSDTRAIMDDAEVVALMSRAKLISQIERLATSNPFRNVIKCRTTEQLERGYQFLRKKLLSGGAVVEEVERCYVFPAESNSFKMNCKYFKMPSTIVKQAEEILEKRKQSKLVKNENQNSLVDVTKNNSSEYQSVTDLVHGFSQQISHLKLEIDAKNAARDEKLLQNVDQRFDKMMNTSLNEKISDLKLEMDAKNVARDEKLLQNVDKRFDKINTLLETVLQEVNLLKNKG